MARTFPAPLYTTVTALGTPKQRKLSSTSPGTTDSLATKGTAVTPVAPGNYYISPEATATLGTLNAVGTASGIGWGLIPSEALVPLSTDGLTTSAGNFTVSIVVSRDTGVASADQTCTFTAILFRANATAYLQEIGRQASSAVTITVTKTAFPVTIAVPSVTFAPGEILWLEIFAASTATSVAGSTATYVTNSATALAITSTTVTYSTNYNKATTEPLAVSDAVARQITLSRALSDNVPIATDIITDVKWYTRLMTDSLATVTDTFTRKTEVIRYLTDAIVLNEAMVRSYAGARSASDSAPVSDSLARANTYTRGLTDPIGTAAAANRPLFFFED